MPSFLLVNASPWLMIHVVMATGSMPSEDMTPDHRFFFSSLALGEDHADNMLKVKTRE